MSSEVRYVQPAASAASGKHRLRPDLRIYPPRAGTPERRYTIYDPVSDLSYFLGAGELATARKFDGNRSIEDVAQSLADDHGAAPAIAKLLSFERKLAQLGLLEQAGSLDRKRRRDPAVGISYGPLKALIMIPVLRMDPNAMLNWLHDSCRWLHSRQFVVLGVLVIAAAIGVLASDADRFITAAWRIYGGDLSWLAWHYPVIVLSIFVHEIGHALTCRVYSVRVTDLGIAVYLLLATGWARPLQGDWVALDKRQRIMTIVMGPYATLLFSAIGVFIWALAPPGSPAHVAGIVMAVSATVALIPTLLPMFNGDTYLALTEYFGVPRLRQRALRYLRDLLRSRPHEETLTTRRKLLYWLTIAGTALGWVIMWAVLLRMVMTFLR